MRFAVPDRVGIAKTITHERTAAGVAGGRPIGTPVFTQKHVLDQIEESGFARAERAGNQRGVGDVEDLAKPVPIHRDDAAEGDPLTGHGATSSSLLTSASPVDLTPA